MTKEQAEKRKKRKKRLLRKRILAILTISIFIVIIIFSVKGVMALMDKNKGEGVSSNSTSSDSIASQSPADTSGTLDDSTLPPQASSEPTQSQPVVINVPDPSLPKPEQSWATTLVNPENPLPADFTTEVRNIKGTEKQYDVRAADSLEAMLADAESAGFKMYLVSTYRTVKYQQGLFDRKTNEYKNKGFDEESAKAEAAKWVAIPGASEHNLGLAADIVSSTWYNNNSDLTESFEDTEHFKWLYSNCTKYGFIIRYPKGKEAITGISYEPWHYRYVGPEAAAYIMANELTLEEFHT